MLTGKIHIIVVRQECDISVSHLYKWALRWRRGACLVQHHGRERAGQESTSSMKLPELCRRYLRLGRRIQGLVALLLGTRTLKFPTKIFIFTSKLRVLMVAGIETYYELVQWITHLIPFPLHQRESTLRAETLSPTVCITILTPTFCITLRMAMQKP